MLWVKVFLRGLLAIVIAMLALGFAAATLGWHLHWAIEGYRRPWALLQRLTGLVGI